MGIKDFLFNLFREDEDSLKEELDELNERVKDLKSQIKKTPKKTKGVKNFFQDTREELDEELKETQETIKDVKKRLKQLKTKPKQTKKKTNYIPTIIILIILAFGYVGYNYFKDKCLQVETSIEDISFGCIKFTEPEKTNMHEITFHLKNNFNYDTRCTMGLVISKNNIEISSKLFDLGIFKSKEARQELIKANIPDGETNYVMEPNCIPIE